MKFFRLFLVALALVAAVAVVGCKKETTPEAGAEGATPPAGAPAEPAK